MVLWCGAHVGGGEEVDGDVQGGERLCQGGPFSEPGGGSAEGDQGRHCGRREGAGAPGGPKVGPDEVEGGECQEGGTGTTLLEG